MKNIYFFAFLLALPIATPAQSVREISARSVQVKGLLAPWKNLPDHIHSARVILSQCDNCSKLELDSQQIASLFTLENFPDTGDHPDMNIDIQVIAIEPYPLLKTSVEKEKKSFWYQAPVESNVLVTLTTQNGQVIYRDTSTASKKFNSRRGASETEAYQYWERHASAPGYLNAWRDATNESIQKASHHLRKQFNPQSETVLIYHPVNADSTFMAQVQATIQRLGQINVTHPSDSSLSAFGPQLDYFQRELLSLNPDDPNQHPRYISCCFNLAQVYRCHKQYDLVMEYFQKLIDIDYKACAPTVAEVAKLIAQKKFKEQYGHTGLSANELKREHVVSVLKKLLDADEISGYLVLNNNDTIRGTFMHINRSLTEQKVVLKYEKRLNDDIAGYEYLVNNISEIHGDDWHLAYILSGKSIYLAEIVWQSQEITLAQSLTSFNVSSLKTNPIDAHSFIKKTNDRYYTLVEGNQANNELSKCLSDCPAIARRASYGYYTPEQLKEAAGDYSKTCPLGHPTTTLLRPKTIRKHQTQKVYLGYYTGVNSFVSALGMAGHIQIKNRLSARMGIGYGSWGWKASIGLKRNFRRNRNFSNSWGYAVGYGYSTGRKKEGNLSTVTNLFSTIDTDKFKDYKLQRLPTKTVSISLIYTKLLATKKRFQFEFGYAFRTQHPYIITNPNGPVIEDAHKYVRPVTPGGLILSIGTFWPL